MNLLGQKITLRRILGMIAGVVIIGIGIAVFKFSRLGNDSISALNLRLAELVGLPFSIENVLMNLCLFVPQLLWGRRYIGLGTIINSFCIGFIVTFTGDAMTAVFGSADTLPVQLLWVAVAVLVIALGCSLYQTADLGVAPYDALSLMLADRLPVPDGRSGHRPVRLPLAGPAGLHPGAVLRLPRVHRCAVCGACLPVGRTDRAGHPDLRLRVRTVRAVLYKAFFGEGAAVQAGEEIEAS